mgnify:CR=1 FL=1
MLTKIKFAPGIDKQDTSVGASGRWVDSDLARFRYGLPEKIGGWSSLLTDTIVSLYRRLCNLYRRFFLFLLDNLIIQFYRDIAKIPTSK